MEGTYALLAEHLTVGDVCRLSMVCKDLHDAVEIDSELWAGIRKRVGLRPKLKGNQQTRRAFLRHVASTRRCCQCAKETRCQVRLPRDKTISLCNKCSADGYARLVSRREVWSQFATRCRGYRPTRAIFRKLTVAKRTAARAHLYWPSEVRSVLRLGTKDKEKLA